MLSYAQTSLFFLTFARPENYPLKGRDLYNEAYPQFLHYRTY